MTTREAAVERYTFRCHHCGEEWVRDYEVVRVTLADGHIREYYSHNGLPVAAPRAPSSVSCPTCGAEHADIHFVVHPDPQGSDQPAQSPTQRPLAGTDPVRAARELADALSALEAAAHEPSGSGFGRVRDVKQVVTALQSGLGHLPQLLDELGSVLDHVESRPSPRHAGDLPGAIRALHNAAGNAHELIGPVVNELAHTRAALATLESFTISSAHESQKGTA